MNQSLVELLVRAGADVNAKNRFGLTPLHCAVLHQNHIVIEMIIRAGAHINAKSCLKRTALHFAISNYQPKKLKRTVPLCSADPDLWVVRKLLDQENILVNISDIRGNTPLMWAVMDKQVEVVLELLRKGANPNIRNKDSLTPLHVALSASDPCTILVVALIFHGANLNFEDKDGKTPIDILIDNVKKTQSYHFAYRCLETIAFSNHRIKKHQKQKLEILPQLWQHLQICQSEVVLMTSDVITNRLTVFWFMLSGFDDSIFDSPVWQVYIPLVDRLLAGIYPKYSLYMLNRFSKSNLCKVLKITIDAKYCDELDAQKCKLLGTQECDELPETQECEELPNAVKYMKRNPVDFFSKMDIFFLCRYLSRFDIFCLIVAFSKGKIHESIEHMREHKNN